MKTAVVYYSLEGNTEFAANKIAQKIGAAERMRRHLTARGFDVLWSSNAEDANYARTMVAVRTPGWEGTNRLAAALKTDRVVVLLNRNSTVDATVFIGHDYQEIINGN